MAHAPAVKPENLLKLIKWVAQEQKYKIEGNELDFQIYLGKKHGVAFRVFKNSAEYIQIHQWEDGAEDYGRAVYSIRNYSDAIQFGNILISSANIRARRLKS